MDLCGLVSAISFSCMLLKMVRVYKTYCMYQRGSFRANFVFVLATHFSALAAYLAEWQGWAGRLFTQTQNLSLKPISQFLRNVPDIREG